MADGVQPFQDPWANWKPPTVTPYNPNAGGTTAGGTAPTPDASLGSVVPITPPTSAPSATGTGGGTPATGTTGTTGAPSAGSSLASQLTQAATAPQTGTTFTKPANIDQMSIPDQLIYYKGNPTAAYQELDRAKQVRDQALAKGDMTGAQAAHAWADQLRQAAGISNTDPFYGSTGGAPQADGSLHLSVNGKPQPDVQVYQGTSYDTADKLAKALGVSYSRDPKTGMPIIGGKTFNAVTFDANGNPQVPTALVAQALGYTANYDAKNGVTITDNKSGQGTGFGTGGPGAAPGASGAGAPGGNWNNWTDVWNTMGAQHPDYMPVQSQFTPDWQTYFGQAHGQIDPLYSTQYNGLMSKQAGDISAMDQKMNARGIFTSGIAQAAENDLRAKTTNAVASLFNKQMSEIQKAALASEQQAYKHYSDGNQFALKYNQDQFNNYLNQQKQTFSQWLGTQNLDLNQQKYALDAWNKTATLMFNEYKFNNPSAGQLLPYTMGPTPYQQDTLGQGQQKIDETHAMNQITTMLKQMGYNMDVQKLTEAIRHNKAGEQNQQDTLNLRLYDMMGFDANGTPTLKRDQLQHTVDHDAQTVQIAKDNATTSANKAVVDGIGKQLSAINSQITAIYNSGTLSGNDANAKQSAVAELHTLSGKRDTYLQQLSGYTNQGFSGGNGSPGSPPGPPPLPGN